MQGRCCPFIYFTEGHKEGEGGTGMKRQDGLLQRITTQADRIPLTPVSIVEIAGDRRVLIEKHFGVRAYKIYEKAFRFYILV